MTHIALEGRCFVLSACQFAQQKDYPPDHAVAAGARDPEAVMIGGGSCIVSPFGKVMVGPEWAGEAVLTAELCLDEVIKGKFDLDSVGHYARNDSESRIMVT
jgi:beta-cyano-L-alanine hydratase/nitrilase